jgi:hypothetical protein
MICELKSTKTKKGKIALIINYHKQIETSESALENHFSAISRSTNVNKYKHINNCDGTRKNRLRFMLFKHHSPCGKNNNEKCSRDRRQFKQLLMCIEAEADAFGHLLIFNSFIEF